MNNLYKEGYSRESIEVCSPMTALIVSPNVASGRR